MVETQIFTRDTNWLFTSRNQF